MYPFPPKKILVPMDLTRVSLAAWQEALGLASRFGATVEALYVREWLPYPLEYSGPDLTRGLKREILAELREKLGEKARIHMLEGDLSGRIRSWAGAKGFELMVMGTHGRKGLEHALFGSVAETVIRDSPIPVWVLHHKAHPVRSVLAPVNFEPYSVKAFQYAAEVAAGLGAGLTALHVTAPEDMQDPAIRARFSELVALLPGSLRTACRPDLQVAGGWPIPTILKAARGHDLVVLSSHRKSLLNDLVLGTTAERVLRYSPVPVLAVPSREPARRRAPEFRLAAVPAA